jgi:hypothetical protein
VKLHPLEELLVVLISSSRDGVGGEHDFDVLVREELVSELCSLGLGSVVGLDVDLGAEALKLSSPVLES